MSSTQNILPLLQSIVDDNITFKFPLELIQKELLNMFMEREEFDYFRMMCYRKLKREYGQTIAHIFLQVMEIKLELQKIDIFTIPVMEYQDRIEIFISTLERLYITRIDKKSPDGEMMSAMV